MAEYGSTELGGEFQQYMNSLPVYSDRPSVTKDDVDYMDKTRNEQDYFWFNRKIKEDPLVVGYNYIFVTAPQLPIHSTSPSLGNRSHATDVLRHNAAMLDLPEAGDSIYNEFIIKTLGGAEPFIPLFTNRALSAVMSDEVLTTLDYSETWNRYKIVLGTTAKDSRISGTFTINYLEDTHITIMKMHRLWIEYIEKVFMGDCVPGGIVLETDMLDNARRIIDYMSSIYQFAVQPDGETLIHWCRYTGCFPTKVPWGEMTSEDGAIDIKKSVPIEYQFSFKEDMSMHVLRDFNLLSSGGSLDNVNGNTYMGAGVRIGGGGNARLPSIRAAGKDPFTQMPTYKLVFPNNAA